jgi:metallophosphoesterase (TIGR00282 family)
MKILFIGDIVGRPGRETVRKWAPVLRDRHGVDITVANAENCAGGLGATPELLQELKAAGVDAFTMGNHTWRKKALIPALETMPELIRPANYPMGVPGRGAMVVETATGARLGVLNLLGRVYMDPFGCPFASADVELSRLRDQTGVILVDMHAETTSEKIAMGWHLDGRCTAVVGTHTHVPTADAWVMPKGTAFICDVGMCGPYHSVIGTDVKNVLLKFRTGMPHPFEVANGPAMFCGVIIDADDNSGRARSIEQVVIRD